MVANKAKGLGPLILARVPCCWGRKSSWFVLAFPFVVSSRLDEFPNCRRFRIGYARQLDRRNPWRGRTAGNNDPSPTVTVSEVLARWRWPKQLENFARDATDATKAESGLSLCDEITTSCCRITRGHGKSI